MTTNADILLIYLICSAWVKGLQISILAFDIVQFFLLLNHQLFLLILDKADFNPRILFFFSNYLIGKKTQYMWNNCISPLFSINIGVGQGSTLFPILFALYISSIFHIFKKRTKNLIPNISVSFLSFVDNDLFILQGKTFEKMNALLFCSYSIISFLFNQFRLNIGNLKFFIFQDHIETLTLLLLILVQ